MGVNTDSSEDFGGHLGVLKFFTLNLEYATSRVLMTRANEDTTEELSRKLEGIYSMFLWIEDLDTEEGKERFKETIKVFEEVSKHAWVSDLIKSKKKVTLLDICGGTGIGGIAFTKVLEGKGVTVELLVNDLRRKALEKAILFSRKILGREIKTVYADASKIHENIRDIDIALLHGLSTPHFNPWNMVRLVSSVARILKPDGLFLVEETDRIYNIFYLTGYKEVLPEKVGKDRVVFTLHSGYATKTGMFKRVVIDLITRETTEMETYFWSIAELAAIMWIFFGDVDFIPIRGDKNGFIIARKPRNIDPQKYAKNPTMLETQ